MMVYKESSKSEIDHIFDNPAVSDFEKDVMREGLEKKQMSDDMEAF